MTEVEFWKNVKVTDSEEDCWEWQRAKINSGHGIVRVNGKILFTHRYSFLLCYGYLPKQINHTCDNPPCCNPLHLYDGTQKDNARDRDTRGRANAAKGSRNSSAKLVENDVINIIKLIKGGMSNTVIAREYNVSHVAISLIKTNRKWKHVPREPIKRYPRKE